MTWHEELTTGITHLSLVDTRLKSLVDAYPRPVFQPHKDYYQELMKSIVSQQLSVKAAATIYCRFTDSFEHIPTPDELLNRDDIELSAVGLSSQKIRYLKDLAARVIDGSVSFHSIDTLSNDEIVAKLTAIKGVGEWTCHMFLIFCMGRLDVLPVGDLGIKNAIQHIYGLDRVPTPAEITDIASKNNWQPYASIVSWYLWQSLENTLVPTS